MRSQTAMVGEFRPAVFAEDGIQSLNPSVPVDSPASWSVSGKAHGQRWMIQDGRAVALLLAATLTILSNSLISPALPRLLEIFKDDPSASALVPLLVTVPSLAVAILAPFAGMLADKFGRRRQLLFGVLLFALAGTSPMWLENLQQIVFSRLLLGVAVALIMTAQSGLIGDLFEGAERANFMGLQIAASNFSGFVMLIIAGRLAEASPYLPFLIYGIAALYLPIMWRILPSAARTPSSPAKAARTHAATHHWPVRLAAVLALAFLSVTGFYLIPTQLPFSLALLGQGGGSAVGLALASLTLAGGSASLVFGAVRRSLGLSATVRTALLGMALGFAILASASSLVLVFGACALVGASTGLLFPMFMSMALDVAPSERRGLVGGAITTSIFLGQFVSPILAGPFIRLGGYAMAFEAGAVLFASISTIVFALSQPKVRTFAQLAVRRLNAIRDERGAAFNRPSSSVDNLIARQEKSK